MITFLPFPDFAESAECLDRERLGKQRLETHQIMRALMEGTGQVNHPATLMWRRYEWSLLCYQEAVCGEWTSRGYSDNTLDRTRKLYYENCQWLEMCLAPHWLNGREFHISHQSNLLRKDIWHYSRYFPDVPLDLPYVWPKPASPYRDIRVYSKQWSEGWMD